MVGPADGGRPGGPGRQAVELYAAGVLVDVVSATPIAPQLLRGARTVTLGQDRWALAWGRRPGPAPGSWWNSAAAGTRSPRRSSRSPRGAGWPSPTAASPGLRCRPVPAARAAGWAGGGHDAAPRTWLALGLAGSGLGLIPWLAYLVVSLPASPVAWHWRAAWAGLDGMEAAGLLSTGILLLRRDPRACLTAAGTAALLLADAWFDVTTAPPGSGALSSLLMAVLAELPAAALCTAIAIRGLSGGPSARARGHAPDHGPVAAKAELTPARAAADRPAAARRSSSARGTSARPAAVSAACRRSRSTGCPPRSRSRASTCCDGTRPAASSRRPARRSSTPAPRRNSRSRSRRPPPPAP